jgi:Hemerythrin HHE cation binding domain
MTITDAPTTRFDLVPMDLYKDVHKGIRAEMFSVVESAGSTDPSDPCARAALSDHVRSLVTFLDVHAHHEDVAILPDLEAHLPAMAERVTTDHASFDRRTAALVDLAATAAEADGPEQRRLGHLLYLDLAAFASAYLAHQDFEERELMPALFGALGFEATLGIHQAIVGSIPPEEMASSLALMLPAMHLDDRAELLGGMQAGAPPEVFQGVWSLAGSVLAPADHAALATRLDLS